MAEELSSTTFLESTLLAIPGASTPMGRVAIFGGAGAAFAYGVKPDISFTPAGEPRPWIVLDPNNPDATLMPHWMWVVLPATIFGVFV